ncbi:MAG: hypothetical protein K2K82_03835 [Muribaculaceae bacterium]|nr:hypothetical protein [Muribaculaceae bacterium]
MKKLKSITLTIIVGLITSVVSYGQVYDIERKGTYPHRYNVTVPVKSSKVISKCHRVNVNAIELELYKEYGGWDLMVKWNKLDDEGILIGDWPGLYIILNDDSVTFGYIDKIDSKITISYLGTQNGYKNYEILVCDLEGNEFKEMIDENSEIRFTNYSHPEEFKKDYNPILGYEDMKGDEPVMLEVIKKWALKSWKNAAVLDRRTKK